MRRTKAILTAVACCIVSTPLAAELKYTVRLESRAVAASAAVDPRMTSLGTKIIRAMVPGDSVELTVIAGSKMARVQWNKQMPGIPAGAFLLLRQNGSRVIVDPAARTFWRSEMPDLYSLPATARPVVSHAARPETATVAGVPATGSRVEITIPFPEARNGLMVAGTPTDLPLSGEVWVTDRFASYGTRELRPIHGLALLGLDVAPIGKLVLRQVLRGPLFGNTEIESAVTSIAEEELPDTLFEVPADFKEVKGPRIRR